MPPHPLCFLPGPTEVEPELRRMLSTPVIGHRTPRFEKTVHAIRAHLAALFSTRAHVLLETAPGTALMEAAVRNLVREGGRIAHLCCGAFGERWAAISRASGRDPLVLDVAWGETHAPEALREALQEASRAGPPVEAVAITHCETSTGALEPLRELAEVVRAEEPEALLLVDAASSLGGVELRFDDWGLDFAFAGTQKCLALPPGLCVYALSERAVERARAVERRGLFWDFVRASEWMASDRVSATPCVPLVLALARQLERIAAEGLERRWRRHLGMRDLVVDWAARAGFEFLVRAPHRSPTVSALRRSGFDVPTLIARALEKGYVLGGGYGKLGDETFRIGHLGDHTVERLAGLLDALGREVSDTC